MLTYISNNTALHYSQAHLIYNFESIKGYQCQNTVYNTELHCQAQLTTISGYFSCWGEGKYSKPFQGYI